MERQQLGGTLFVLAGFIFLGVSVAAPFRVTWFALGIMFLVLGAARIRRARRG